MGFWTFFFGKKEASRSRLSFKGVDWLDIEHRWATVEALAQSQSQADLKQALIQADVLFDSILKQASIPGKTMGERLKSLKFAIPREVYQQLWQAHLKRNELVHDAGSFVAEWEKTTHLNAFKNATRSVRGIR